jgi:YwiC-like protein
MERVNGQQTNVIRAPAGANGVNSGSACFRGSGARLGVPPLPREHGAWLMLLAPFLIPLVAAPSPRLFRGCLLLVAAVSAFGLQYVAGLILRRRRIAPNAPWFALYLASLLAGLLPLVRVYRLSDLLLLAPLGAVLFGINVAAMLLNPRRRFDRSLPGEIVGVLALTLTGPAAYVVACGRLDHLAWQLWVACVLHFTSGVFLVNLLLTASRTKDIRDRRVRWHLGRGHLLYHAALAMGIAYVCLRAGGRSSLLWALAFAPVIVRAVTGWAALGTAAPTLKQVGRREACYTAWFAGCLVALLRLAF